MHEHSTFLCAKVLPLLILKVLKKNLQEPIIFCGHVDLCSLNLIYNSLSHLKCHRFASPAVPAAGESTSHLS